MEIKNSKYQKELEAALEAAEKAGQIMDSYRDEEILVKDRKTGLTDIVTQADEDCQNIILNTIKDSFPEDSFLGEEKLDENNDSDRTWIIDPIDGTFNFQKGLDYFCTSIALEVGKEIKLGVVYSPKSGLNKLFYGVEDSGAYLEEDNHSKRLETSEQRKLPGSLIQVEMLEKHEGRWSLYKKTLDHLREKNAQFRKEGSVALNLCKTAEGSFDGSIDYAFTWDFAAARLIVKEAGGKIRYRENESGELNEAVTSNSKLQETLESMLDHYK